MSNRTYHPRGKLVHGFRCSEHPLYSTWADMLARCTNESEPSYSYYGGRGIRVCARWFHFENFALDMGLKPSPELTLERRDNDEGYRPGNCVWATRSQQCHNRRTFKNNTSSVRGVVVGENGRHIVRFDHENVRYQIGIAATIDEAAAMRTRFVELFFKDKAAAIASISGETLWCTSSTKVRGIVPHKDGGFIARCTIAGTRHYVGYFKTIDEAQRERDSFIKRKTEDA